MAAPLFDIGSSSTVPLFEPPKIAPPAVVNPGVAPKVTPPLDVSFQGGTPSPEAPSANLANTTGSFSGRSNPDNGPFQTGARVFESKTTPPATSTPDRTEPVAAPLDITPPKITQSSNIVMPVEPKIEGLNPSKTSTQTSFGFENTQTGKREEFGTYEEMQKRKNLVESQAAKTSDAQTKIDLEKKANDDFLTKVTNFNADIADPKTPDPIKTAQMNEMILQFGPENQAATDSMLLQLKQDGLDGNGAGNALMLLMNRGNQAQFANMVQRLNTESQQRIYDMNKWGADFGLRMRQDIRNQETVNFSENASRLAIASEAGDWDLFSSVAGDMGLYNIDTSKLSKMDDFERAEFMSTTLRNLGFAVEGAKLFSDITGVALDPTHLASLDPATQAIIDNRLNAISKITDLEAQKQAMIQLAMEYPETFGFPGEPEKAAAMAQNMDFQNSAGNLAASQEATKFWRMEAITDSPNLDGVISAGKGMWQPHTDEYIDSTFNANRSLFDSLSDEGQDMIFEGMAGFGVRSLTDIDTREEQEAFLSLMKFNEQRKNVGGISQEIFDTLSKETMGTELHDWFDGDGDTKDSAAKAWIVENIVIGGNYTRDENTGLLTITSDKMVPPWNESFNQFTFLTWPRKYDSQGNALPEGSVYNGGEFRDELGPTSAYNDPANIVEDKRLTDAYLSYKKENPDGLNWMQWYEDTKGGTKKVEKPFSVVDATTQFINDSQAAFESAITAKDYSGLTQDQWASVLDNNPNAITELQNSGAHTYTGTISVDHDGNPNTPVKNIFNTETWNATGLKADKVLVDGDSSAKGAGEGGGSVIIFNGKPMRIVSFTSSKGSTSQGKTTRQGVIMAVPIGEPGATPISIVDTGPIIASGALD